MKKRILILCGILVLMAALSLLPAGATEPTTTQDIDFSAGGTVSAVCPHCKGEAVDWLPLTQEVATGWGTNYDPSSGTHYYVAETSVTVSNGFAVASNEELCLHLNGNTVTRAANGARAVTVNGKLRIMDHTANEGVIQAYGSTTSTGCVIRVPTDNAQLDLYGGTVQMLVGSTTASKYAGTGGCVYLTKATTFNMHGGTITGGIAMAGGNVFIGGSATFTMTGGTITGGSIKNATSSSVDVDDHFGGNLYLAAGAQATLSGGSITNGTSTSSGGNISNAGTLTIDGCTITGGTGTYGANIRCTNTSTLNLLSGTVSGGNSSKSGGNIYTDGVIKLGACTVENGHSDTQGHNIRMNDEAQLTVLSTFTGLTTINMHAAHLPETFEGGRLTDTLDGCEGVFAGKIYLEGTEQLVSLQGKADDTKLYTVVEEEDFSGTGAMVAKCQHCATQVIWSPLTAQVWTDWAQDYTKATNNHYYLVDESANFSKTLTIQSGETLCLHLNGKKFVGKSTRAFDISSGTFNLMDHAANNGQLSAMHGSGTAGAVIRMNGTFNMYGGQLQIRSGTYSRSGNGSILYIGADDTFNMYGGSISGGIGENGGNIYVASGATCNLAGGTVSGGQTVKVDDTDGYGGNIYNNGTVILGNANVTGGTTAVLGSDIYSSATGQLIVKADFAGTTYAAFNTAHLPDPILGGNLADTLDSCEGPFTGTLYLENSPQLPTLYGVENDTKLYIPDTALVKKDGTKVWYSNGAAAMEAYDSSVEYLVAGSGELVVDGGSYTVDIAGTNLAVSGTGTVTLFDSANKDYTTYGTATVTGVTVANAFETEVAGTKYYMIKEDETYSFHCIKVALSGVSIRPSSSGMYYTGTWSCDDKMAQQLVSFGVAVSLRATPTADFAETSHCLYTEFGTDQWASGTQKTGVIIEGILKEANTAAMNNRYGRMPIYATAYLKLTDGTVLINEESSNHSLYTSMTLMDTMIAESSAFAQQYLSIAREFYEKWKFDGMSSWNLQNIPAPPPSEDGVLNLLMVGNSFCYYYVQELYELLMENPPEGVTEVNIYNLYYSGCRLDQHLTWWQNGTAKYEFYKTDANGRNELNPDTPWTLEQALVMENWDYISLQGMPTNGSYSKAEETQLHLTVAELAEPLLDRFHALHPEAQLLWHRTWYFEIGRVSGSTTYTEEIGVTYNAGMQFVCDYMCNEWDLNKPYDLVQVNTGQAWTQVRAAEGVNDLLPFGGLCARLGYTAYGDNLAGYEGETANSGDGYHDGDIGGGQLVNACVWYETLTGNDSRESDYVPSYTRSGMTYTLSDALCEIIREASHNVVSQMPETVQPAG